jgi:hypothetical protein
MTEACLPPALPSVSASCARCISARLILGSDALNHAIPGRDELEDGLRVLVGAGPACGQSEGFRLTTAGERLVAEAAGNTRDWHLAWDRVRGALEEQPYPAERADVRISQEDCDRAVRADQRAARRR